MDSQFLHTAFYLFTPLNDPESWVTEIAERCKSLSLLGTIHVAQEGINGMLSGARDGVESFEDWLRAQQPFEEIVYKRSLVTSIPFSKLLVRNRQEIVTMRVADPLVPWETTAEHLPPRTFRNWVREGKEMVLIDTRNDFEVQLGSFKGAINPQTTAFHEFPEWVMENRALLEAGKPVVMFCTGGIRCEKATSWMLERGFENVYQLEGGIIQYFHDVADAEKDFDGELFVFDDRITVDTKNQETRSSTIKDSK